MQIPDYEKLEEKRGPMVADAVRHGWPLIGPDVCKYGVAGFPDEKGRIHGVYAEELGINAPRATLRFTPYELRDALSELLEEEASANAQSTSAFNTFKSDLSRDMDAYPPLDCVRQLVYFLAEQYHPSQRECIGRVGLLALTALLRASGRRPEPDDLTPQAILKEGSEYGTGSGDQATTESA